jgi:hypothetical protein
MCLDFDLNLLEASSLDIDFSLVFHYNTSKPKASNVSSSLVFDYVHQSKQHKPNVVGVCNLMDLRVHQGCGFDGGKSIGCLNGV